MDDQDTSLSGDPCLTYEQKQDGTGGSREASPNRPPDRENRSSAAIPERMEDEFSLQGSGSLIGEDPGDNRQRMIENGTNTVHIGAGFLGDRDSQDNMSYAESLRSPIPRPKVAKSAPLSSASFGTITNIQTPQTLDESQRVKLQLGDEEVNTSRRFNTKADALNKAKDKLHQVDPYKPQGSVATVSTLAEEKYQRLSAGDSTICYHGPTSPTRAERMLR